MQPLHRVKRRLHVVQYLIISCLKIYVTNPMPRVYKSLSIDSLKTLKHRSRYHVQKERKSHFIVCFKRFLRQVSQEYPADERDYVSLWFCSFTSMLTEQASVQNRCVHPGIRLFQLWVWPRMRGRMHNSMLCWSTPSFYRKSSTKGTSEIHTAAG